MSVVVVTRHPGLVDYLRTQGIDVECVRAHVTAEEIRGKCVVGVLPMHLAAEAKSVTEVTLNLTADQRGRELSYEEVAAAASDMVTYKVTRIS